MALGLDVYLGETVGESVKGSMKSHSTGQTRQGLMVPPHHMAPVL